MATKYTPGLYVFLICALIFPFQILAQSPAGFTAIKQLDPIPISRNTGEKPQSKLWTYNCSYWAVLSDNSGTHLWRLQGEKWKSVLKLSDKLSYADAKVVDSLAHILLFTGQGKSLLVSLEYSKESNTYQFWSERPNPSQISLHINANTATIDIDNRGRMWLASDTDSDITVQWSDHPYKSWSTPITLANNVSYDDISSVIAMNGKVGVLWSNLNAQRFGFRVHNDGDAPEAWSANEVPASQSALNIFKGMSDDHVNVAIASDGTLYCAVKTEYDTENYPKIALLIRRPSGKWDDLYEVSQKGTKPIVLLNEEEQKVKVVYTAKDRDSDIVYKESSTENIAFSPEQVLIKGTFNNVTSSKANYVSDIVIMATDSSRSEAVSVLATDSRSFFDECHIDNIWTVFPNPFALKTTVYFSLSESGNYSLTLFDAKGAHVANIHSGYAESGKLNTVDVEGDNFSRGMYIVRLQSNETVKTLKIVLDK